jgi:hypothetical protein
VPFPTNPGMKVKHIRARSAKPTSQAFDLRIGPLPAPVERQRLDSECGCSRQQTLPLTMRNATECDVVAVTQTLSQRQHVRANA